MNISNKLDHILLTFLFVGFVSACIVSIALLIYDIIKCMSNYIYYKSIIVDCIIILLTATVSIFFFRFRKYQHNLVLGIAGGSEI